MIFLGMDLQTINSFLTIRRIATTCRLLITTTRAVLNDPELSDFEKILYSVLICWAISNSYFFFEWNSKWFLIFFRKMEMVVEKIEVVGSHKNNLIDIFSVGQKIHETINACGENCASNRYLFEINNLLENMDGQETTEEEKLTFLELSMKNLHSFLLFDQINKKFGLEIYQLDKICFKFAIFFEIEKIKSYLKTNADIEKLEGKLYVLSKTFV